jgi:Hydrazine synthase alpha subunit middle domain/WD40-like Beta Propeller Repeat
MNNFRPCDNRHGLLKLVALTLPMLLVLGCSSASSGHAPGVAGGETLTPGITNYPLAYIKRPAPPGVPTKATPDINVLDLITSTTGGDVYVRSQANAAGAEVNITLPLTQGKGDVRDLDVSPDGTHLIFSLRLPLNPGQDNTAVTQPNWHIYQYDATTQVVTQLTNDSITAGHDVGARYLPDGRIVFASTRQLATQSILLNEGRPQYQAVTNNGPEEQAIFLLHVMNADGTGMHQISFNTNHDFAPSVLSSGQVVFSRWELVNGANQISLYRANPDGTGLELYYGANSHATGANIAGSNDNVIQFLGARQRVDGTILAIARPILGTQLGGDIVQINAAGFVEIHQLSTPTGTAATGQSSATTLGITTDANKLSLGGRFAAAYPLYDGTNRMLVSWSPCLVLDSTVTPAATHVCTTTAINGTTIQQAPPQYTLWVYDFDAGTLSPMLSADSGTMITEPVILQARKPALTNIPDSTPTTTAAQEMATNGVGLLNISSVYDFGGVDIATPNIAGQANPGQANFYARPYRFIRIQKAVEIPGKKVRKLEDSAFGPLGRAQGMREILGYAPIQPDGSVQVQVPANVPFTIDIIDANARRVIPVQHSSWLQLLPGETKSCNGCHSTVATTSHGRSGLTTAVNLGAPTTGSPFPNTNPQLFANAGETMAQTLARITCETGSLIICTQLLSPDVTYTNIWTTGVTLPAGLPTDNPISYLYSALSTPSPILADFANCSPWTAQCRATVEYFPNQPPLQVGQLQPIWNLSPRFATVNNVVGTTNVSCTNCHSPLSTPVAPAAAVVQVPAGNLDLTGGASNVVTTVVTSYEQLLFSHPEQALNMGVLQDVVPTVTLAAPMTAGSAAGATAFFRMFEGNYLDPVLDHRGYLTPAELRLISEWIDIGGQFYNDPFVAPAAAN